MSFFVDQVAVAKTPEVQCICMKIVTQPATLATCLILLVVGLSMHKKMKLFADKS